MFLKKSYVLTDRLCNGPECIKEVDNLSCCGTIKQRRATCSGHFKAFDLSKDYDLFLWAVLYYQRIRRRLYIRIQYEKEHHDLINNTSFIQIWQIDLDFWVEQVSDSFVLLHLLIRSVFIYRKRDYILATWNKIKN